MGFVLVNEIANDNAMINADISLISSNAFTCKPDPLTSSFSSFLNNIQSLYFLHLSEPSTIVIYGHQHVCRQEPARAHGEARDR